VGGPPSPLRARRAASSVEGLPALGRAGPRAAARRHEARPAAEAVPDPRHPARGTAMCRLSEFIDALEALSVEDRAWFAYWLSELLVTACDAKTALR